MPSFVHVAEVPRVEKSISMLRDLNAPFMDIRRALRVSDGIVETNSELVKLVFDASAT